MPLFENDWYVIIILKYKYNKNSVFNIIRYLVSVQIPRTSEPSFKPLIQDE